MTTALETITDALPLNYHTLLYSKRKADTLQFIRSLAAPARDQQDAPDEVIANVSTFHFVELSTVIPGLITADSLHPGQVSITAEGQSILTKIIHFFIFIRYYTHITTAELLHIHLLLHRLLLGESRNKQETQTCMVSIANLGTLLVCAAIIGLKMNRDHPIKNSWWASMFSVDINVLNQSEIVYLQNIGYRTTMSFEEYQQAVQLFDHTSRTS